jgi:hypothetical protein
MTSRSDDGGLAGHGPPGDYLRSLREVAGLLDGWVADCIAFDADPGKGQTEKQALPRRAGEQSRSGKRTEAHPTLGTRGCETRYVRAHR